jgi:hypothetical protein
LAPPLEPRGPYADKLWREALRRAVLKRVEGEQNLDKLATATVRRALDDNDPRAMAAVKEIGDRLDGKPAQDIAVKHTSTNDLSKFTDEQLNALIARGLGALRRSSETEEAAGSDQGKLH